MAWVEAAFSHDESKISFRVEDVLYFCEEYKGNGTDVVIGKHGSSQSISITTPYSEFKEKMDDIKNFQRQWANAMVQGSSPGNVTVVPLNEVDQYHYGLFKQEDLRVGQYIRFKEEVPFSTRSKMSKGWIKSFSALSGGKFIVNVRCDDNYRGARGTTTSIEDIVEILADKEQPDDE